ncbi:MAG: FecR domain-containing protein [Gammaproteobacteria bacterium]|jgi:transmembrane sensor
MNNIITIPEREDPERAAIAAEARAWLVQLDGGRPSRQALAEFREWLDRSGLHRAQFRLAASSWNELDNLAGLLDADAPARPGRLRLPSYTLAAALALAVGAGGYIAYRYWQGGFGNNAFTAEYATAVGGLKSVVLPDGSRIRMNTASRVTVSFNREARLIHLDAGEAWFKVAHDNQKPFVVYAGKYAVKDLGTAFSIRVKDNGIDLTVTRGRVEVASLKRRLPARTWPDPDSIKTAPSRFPLKAGQHVVFDQGIELAQKVKPAQLEKMLSWRDGMLIFDNDPLEKVVAEINRYTPVRIVISDSHIRNLRFGGYFRTNDVPSILATLQKGFGIHVEKINDKLIYLSRQKPSD